MTSVLVETSEGPHSIANREIREIKMALIAGVKEAIGEGYKVTEEILNPAFVLLDAGQYTNALRELEEELPERYLYNGRTYLDRYLDYWDGVKLLDEFIGH
jgi:hypothetical protein